MGCYDTVYVECKNCGNRVEFQSKADYCTMSKYVLNIDSIPPAIAGDLDGESRTCSCGQTITIITQTIMHVKYDL